jgi:hypothetical protein
LLMHETSYQLQIDSCQEINNNQLVIQMNAA